MHVRAFRLVAVLMLAFAAAGCGFKKPSLRFKTVNLKNTDLGGTNIEVVYTLKNPNPIGIPLSKVSYQLEVEGKRVVSGQPKNGLDIGANRSTDLVFPARVVFSELAAVIETFLTKDTASYRVSGEIGIKTPLGKNFLTFPLSRSGTFSVPKIPSIQITPPSIHDLSFSGARVVFPLQVTNRNSFPLPIVGFDANFHVSGQSVGSVAAPMAGMLGAGESRIVNVPVDVRFAQTGMAVANALRTKRAQIRLQGTLRSGVANIPIVLSENVSFR